jgi:MOB kinase activator 1
MLYDTITEFCTEQTCPIMSAGSKYEYQWEDGQKIKKSIKCSAPKHIDYILNWIQSQLDNEQIFPTIKGNSFHKDFLKIHSKLIFERLFRVFAHIYSEHFQQILQLGEEIHLFTSFKHFILFSNEFNLIEKKDLQPLQDLIKIIN